MRAAPTGHSQSQSSVGNAQRTLYEQLRTLLSQTEESTGLMLSSESPMFTWAVKHAQWLSDRYLTVREWKNACSQGRITMVHWRVHRKGPDTEADDVILGNASRVFEVCTVKLKSLSQQWNVTGAMKKVSTNWQPREDGVEFTAFVTPHDIGPRSERPSEASSRIGSC